VTDPDTTLKRIDDALGTCICGVPLTKTGTSLDYCTEDCQQEWQGRQERRTSFAVPLRNGTQTANTWAEAARGYTGDWDQIRDSVLRRDMNHGGPVMGPGAWTTSDSIPARLSPGGVIADDATQLRPGATPWSATIPVIYDFIDRDAINNLISGFDHDDPRATVADDLNRIQDEVWGSLLVSIHGSTIDDANGDIEDGSEVFIGFDVTGDTITWAAVSGNNTWRTGSFPIPADADQDALAAMGQMVVKGRWSTQPTDRSTT